MRGVRVRSRAASIVAVVVSMLVLLVPKAAGAATLPMLRNLGGGKCLAVAGGSSANNAVLVQYNCDGDPTRRWNVTAAVGQTGVIKDGGTGKCATPGGQGLNTLNWHLDQFTCDGNVYRTWYVSGITVDGIYSQYANLGSGFCMGINGDSKDNNAIIVQQTCTGDPFQFWQRF